MRVFALLVGVLLCVPPGDGGLLVGTEVSPGDGGPSGGRGSLQNSLPDRDTFFAEVRKRLASNYILQGRFTYKERATDVRFNPFGKMGTGPQRVAQVFPSPEENMTYRRVIERDGQPVPPAEIARQDREFLARYREWQRKIAREGRSERDARLRREEEEERQDRELATEALGLLDFTLDRREQYDGQPAIIVTFKPRPDAQPRTREGRIVRNFAGTVWVHEHEYEVMRVEAKAVDDTSFGFGVIGRLHEGASALFLRRRVHGVWLPVENRFKGTGRALLFRKIAFDYVRVFYDYEPWDPTTLPKILADGPQGSR